MAVVGRLAAVLVALAVLAVASSVPAQDSVTVKLEPQGGSQGTGTATLTKAGDKKTKVVISVSPAASESQPTHIHKGTCKNLDAKPAFPLSPVAGGKSETVVNASIDDLKKGYAINGHKSAQDLKTYVFCGDIKG
jgi:Cu/Zn superoxide dismutase